MYFVYYRINYTLLSKHMFVTDINLLYYGTVLSVPQQPKPMTYNELKVQTALKASRTFDILIKQVLDEFGDQLFLELENQRRQNKSLIDKLPKKERVKVIRKKVNKT